MINLKIMFRFCVVLFLTTITCCIHAQQPSSIKPSVKYIQAPLFVGLSHNAAMRIRIYVPVGKEVSYRQIHLNLDQEAIKAIDKIDMYFKDDVESAFNSNNPIVASVTPSSNIVNLPVDIKCKAGLNYIWVSTVLKTTANIDKKIKVSAIALTTNKNIKQILSQSHTNQTFRLGIAVRKAGDDNVHTYRIPGIITTDKGTLISVYDIRYNNTRDLPGNIDVGMSRSTDGGKTWQPMKNIMDMGAPHENNGIGDPTILFDPATKKIWVAALWSKGNRSIAGSKPGLSPDTTGQFVLVHSDDDGLTWSTPETITQQVKNPIWHLYFNGPGNGIVMQNGTLVFPSQYWDENKIPHSAIIYSKDQGKTWTSGIGAKSNTTESQVIETTPGTLMLNMRDNRGNYRSIATTTDMGKTWVEHHSSQMALPDPVCMASIIKARVNVKGMMKDVVFFSNVATQNSRNNTTIKASTDLGESWLSSDLLLDERRTFGYSALTKIDDHNIGILYEGERDMYFLRIPVKDIIK